VTLAVDHGLVGIEREPFGLLESRLAHATVGQHETRPRHVRMIAG
jgi:hypothetical protein